MFRFLFRKLRFIKTLLERPEEPSAEEISDLSPVLEETLNRITRELGASPDIVVRRFFARLPASRKAAVVFVDGLADKTIVNQHILKPLMQGADGKTKHVGAPLMVAGNLLVTAGETKTVNSFAVLVEKVLSGDTALLIDGAESVIVISSKGWEKRSISEPDTEVIIKGPRDGFVETLRTNTALLRRKIGHPALTYEAMVIGKKTRTDVTIAYIRGLARRNLVEEVRRRLKQIDTDAILAAGFIQEYIEDAPFSLFATVSYTERPDVCAAKLLEGRVAVFVDGTPVVNIVPKLFVESFQSPDDYNFRPYYSTLIRWIRYLSFAISVFLPALYVAISDFHQELVPTPLLVTMAAAHEGTPFPTLVEAIVMGFIFEALREAGIRLPRPIGQAVSIVGALVIGEATVSAGLASAPMVIVVALTAITSFVVPTLAEPSALLRLFFIGAAGFMGLYGIVFAFLAVWIHLSSLRSFGVPYMSPIAPLIPQDMKDVAVRVPLWAMFTRPQSIGVQDPVRQKFRLTPEPPDDDTSQA